MTLNDIHAQFHLNGAIKDASIFCEQNLFEFLANVNSRSRSLYAVARPSKVRFTGMLCYVRRLSVFLREGELGPHLTECGQGRGLPANQVSS